MLLKEIGKAKSKVARAFGLEPAHDARQGFNGEQGFLKLIASIPEISRYDAVIDVGANRGDWTAAAIEQFAAKGIRTFYCVEPIPAFAKEIKGRFANVNGIELVERVLSDRSGGKAEIFEAGGGGRMYRNYLGDNQASSGTKKMVSHQIEVTTGDDVFTALNIKPYLVKIDCDGHDFHVLRGFEQTLRSRRPLVQFEYSDFWIGAGSRLREACRFLDEAGYNTYRMFPDRLARFNFSPLFETFAYQNIVAVPREFVSLSAKTIALSSAGWA